MAKVWSSRVSDESVFFGVKAKKTFFQYFMISVVS